ncbi:hypothetical protein NBRC110019_16810 [Neptunitalea chrysea]|uniref:Uncharacterized protein n=1 Tax=Neptunitalea chrysea TaxID=1647581 RepID=A0A9W6EV90_9FLAO|nr:hypothetical protein [Neptunitalea chrysea]GLB52641.1 hypothetical protein NBRC110019_16810 [Neptunitalea chrysea]
MVGIDFAIRENNVCDDNVWYEVFEGAINSEVVVFVNSRAVAHYDPCIIEDVSGFSCYNIGLSGTPLNLLKIRWDAYVNHNLPPKLLILDVDAIILGSGNKLFNKFEYLPYLNMPEYENVIGDIDSEFIYENTSLCINIEGMK